MKLHLNLTLRRAVLAAMAMVALGSAQAATDITYANGNADAYITGTSTLTPNEWNQIWHKAGSLTIGNYLGDAEISLDGSTYNHGGTIFIGGTGAESKQPVANDGVLHVGSSTMNVEGELNVGYSLVGGTGELTIDGGKVQVGDRLYVGGYAGSGSISATNATITVTGGSNDPKYDNVFAMGYRNSNQDGIDEVFLKNSTLTVGAAGGKIDVTTIGRGGGYAFLTLDQGSTATFHDQTIVGEKSGSHGEIMVMVGNTLNLGSSTILGYEQGAEGSIIILGTANATGDIYVGKSGWGGLELMESGKLSATGKSIILGSEASGEGLLDMSGTSTATADKLYIGTAGKGNVLLADTASLTATSQIVVGTNAGSLIGDPAGNYNMTSTLVTEAGTKLTTPLLSIGDTNTGSAVIGGTLDTDTLQLGRTATGNGSLTIEDTATVDTITNLIVGYEGTGVLNTSADLTATNATVAGTSSKLNIDGGTTKLTEVAIVAGTLNNNAGTAELKSGNTLVMGGTINTAAGAETSIDTLLLTDGASLTNAGTTNVDYAAALDSSITAEAGAKTSIESLLLSNNSKLTSAGDTTLGDAVVTESASIEATDGILQITTALANSGNITVSNGATMQTETSLANDGSITNNGSWYLDGSTNSSLGSITNNGTMTLKEGATLVTSTVEGSGDTTLNTSAAWTITGQTTQDIIENNGESITIQGAGRIVADTLCGTGFTAIVVDKTSVSTADGEAVIAVTNPLENIVGVSVDVTDAAGLLGKKVDFVSENGTLLGISDDLIAGIDGDAWTKNRIDLGNDKRLEFTSGGDAINGYTGVHFTKVAEVLATDGDLVFEKTTQETEVKEIAGVADEDKAKLEEAIDINNSNSTLQTVTIKDTTIVEPPTGGGTTPAPEENKIGLVVSAGVASSSLTVETVAVLQQTIDNGTVTSSTLVGTTGMVLVLDGEATHEGKVDKSKSHLGFADELNGATLTTKDDAGVEETKEIHTVDHIRVTGDSSITIQNLTTHSTHTLEVQDGATLTFSGVDAKIGGSTDKDIKEKKVTVNKFDENGNIVLGQDGKPVTEEKIVENKNSAHLETGSTIKNATVTIEGGSIIVFEKVHSEEGHLHLGQTTVSGESKVIIKSKGDEVSTLGSTEEHAQQIVFETGTQLKGTGHVKNIHLDKGAKLTVGSSPGVMKASNLTNNGTTEFYFITNSSEWQNHNNGAGITATEGTGAISQLYVDANVTLNGDIKFVYQEKVGNEYETLSGADQEAARKLIGSYITEDTVITFVTGNTSQLTLAESFDILEETLPILQDGMEWNLAEMLTAGTATVISEKLEEPWRIANTLVSAGETVLNFGRLASSQASLRKAGTTRTWASAIANFDSVDGSSTANGYSSDTWGAAVGVDHAFAKNTVMGVALARTYGENTPDHGTEFYDAGSIDQDATMVGIYGTHKFRTKGLMNDVKLNAFAAYGWFENDSSRSSLKKAHNATAEWDSNAWVLSASLSRDITSDDGLVVSPYVGVEYTKASMDDFTEKGRTYEATYTADQDYSNLAVKVGVNVSKTMGSFTPYAGIAYINDVSRDTPKVTATGKRDTITGKAAMPGRSAVQLKVGANWQLTESWDLNAGYNAELRDGATEHNANVGVGYTF